MSILSSLPATLLQSLPILCPLYKFYFQPESSKCCSHAHGHGLIHWGMGNLPVATPTENVTLPPPESVGNSSSSRGGDLGGPPPPGWVNININCLDIVQETTAAASCVQQPQHAQRTAFHSSPPILGLLPSLCPLCLHTPRVFQLTPYTHCPQCSRPC